MEMSRLELRIRHTYLYGLLRAANWIVLHVVAGVGTALYMLSIFGTRAGRQQYWWAQLEQEIILKISANEYEQSHLEMVIFHKLGEYNEGRMKSLAFRWGCRLVLYPWNGWGRTYMKLARKITGIAEV